MSAYELAVAGLSSQAITEAAQRFISGVVEGQSIDFAPAAPRFALEARQRQEYIDLKAKPRIPVYRHHTGAPFYMRQEKTRTKYMDHRIIAENVGYDQWCRLSRGKEVPVGAIWVASLGTVFAPLEKS